MAGCKITQSAFTCSKSMETTEKCVKSEVWNLYHWPFSGVVIVNFEQNSDIVLVFPLLTLNKWMLTGY